MIDKILSELFHRRKTDDCTPSVNTQIDRTLKPDRNTLIQSALQYYNRVKVSVLKQNETNPDLQEYWTGYIRDASGRWSKYHKIGDDYFIGTKPQINFRDKKDIQLIIKSLAISENFIKAISDLEQGMTDRQFLHWLIEQHKIRAMIPETKGKVIDYQVSNQSGHTPFVTDGVLPIAQRYNDPYKANGIRSPMLEGIPAEGLPRDIWYFDAGIRVVGHEYPAPQYFPVYIHRINQELISLLQMDDVPIERKIEKIASIHQYGVNARMFKRTNQAFFLNISNALLKVMGLKPIEGGILDFVGMRLQPENFVKYFYDEVKRVNPNLE